MKIRTNNQTGFTILELMIATIVFSTVLLIATTSVIQISKAFYKGFISSATQETTRNIIEEISRAIQFSGGSIVGSTAGTGVAAGQSYFCINNKTYTYVLGKQVVDGATPTNALTYENTATCTPPTSATLGAGARQLVPAKMRLANLALTNPTPNVYTITVRVVYGDDDLLNNASSTTANCKSTAGNQFCAVSELSTTVIKRVQ